MWMNLLSALYLNLVVLQGSTTALSYHSALWLGFGIAALGLLMSVFLVINHRSNLKRQKSMATSEEQPGQERTFASASGSAWALIDKHPTPTALCDEGGHLMKVNAHFARVFGSTPENLNQLKIFNLLPAQLAEPLSQAFANPATAPFQSKVPFFSPNTRDNYCLQLLTLPAEKGHAAEQLLTLHPHRQAEEPIKPVSSPSPQPDPGNDPLSDEDPLQNILDQTPLPLLIENNQGKILRANKAACTLLGADCESIATQRMDSYFASSPDGPASSGQAYLVKERHISYKTIIYPLSGKALPAEVRVSSIKYQGQSALLYMISDLSEAIEKKKELDEYKIKSEESDRLKSSFLANLSHEVRTPMNSILGFAELLAEPDINAKERKEFIRLIRQSGKELLSQINNMIDFSKIEAGLIQLKVEICNFETLFHQLHEFWLEDSQNTNEVKLFFELPPEIQRNGIASDRLRLKQILKVFLSNSIKFTQKGVIEMGIRSKAPQLYEFYIRDTGVGIPADKHQQVFEKFRQANDSNSREFSGMGLGLSMAARLIQFLGGHQWVISETGQGSEFRFVLPDLLFPQGSPFLQVSSGPTTMLQKIMVIAPDQEIYLDLNHNSKPVNYQVFWAQNAQEMKAMMLSNNIRFILVAVDLLPFWQELLPKIHGINPKAKIIGVAGQLDSKRKERLVAMGLDDVIRTPVNIPILLNIVEEKELSSMNILSTVFHQN